MFIRGPPAYQEVVAAFHASYPGVRVQHTNLRDPTVPAHPCSYVALAGTFDIMVSYVAQQVMALAHVVEEAQIPAGPGVPGIAVPLPRLEARIARVGQEPLEGLVHLCLLAGREFGVRPHEGSGEAEFHP